MLRLSAALFTCASLGLLSARAEVTMLVPGFTVTELPVKISNLNNLRFAPDGTLTALGYDGRVHLLRDTNNDGLEDSDTLFWDKPTLSVPVGMVWSTNGLYISSHGKVSLLRDTNHDGKADDEQVIASGWPPTDVGAGGVDAAALTLDPQGNLYFGLLTADYSNPYRLTNGVSKYDLKGQRGTIQKWNAATKSLETYATGIRVPYTLAFNRAGDLFVSDQEGETWCPNGNPLDEINQIIPGKNYGFPPRHPKHLPDLISEPPVVAFAPQHQSICGFVFNEPTSKQKLFGPSWWEGDLIAAGESRGKLFRVRMTKTPDGYVGRETIIARLDMLTTDVAISPHGDLYVSCHSGKPDWGTGPTGPGKIYKIHYVDPAAPQPAAIWASDLFEVTIAFDKPIDPSITNRAAEMKIEFGDYVSAADRLEVLKPPYKVVTYQETTPRGKLSIHAATLSKDGRTLRLATDAHSQSVRYALTLPGLRAPGSSAVKTIDLGYDLTGAEAAWAGPDRKIVWQGWLPHFDPAINAAWTAQSPDHDEIRALLKREGVLMFRTYVDAPGTNPQPHIQAASSNVRRETDGRQLFSVGIKTPVTEELHFTYTTDIDPQQRILPLHSLLPQWSPLRMPPLPMPEIEKQITGGDYERGRELFFGERLKCSSCHRIRGEGATVGPDLSNLAHRDVASVLRDIVEPSLAINPDYVAYNLVLNNNSGEEPVGFIRAQNTEGLRLISADGKERIYKHEEIRGLKASNVSLMPSGLLVSTEDKDVRGLLAFLVSTPPTRATNDISSLLKDAPDLKLDHPINLILVAGPQDHGKDQHDYPAWQTNWTKKLSADPTLKVSTAWEWPSDDQWKTADAIVFYFWNHDWSDQRLQQIDQYQHRGGGLVMLHAACIADKDPGKLAERIGYAAQAGNSRFIHAPFDLNFAAPTNHTIALNPVTLPFLDEPYWPLIGNPNLVKVLATAEIEGQPRPLIWTYERNRGRVFVSIPGHYTWTWADPVFEALTTRAIRWVAMQNK